MGNIFNKEIDLAEKANMKLEIPMESLHCRDRAEELQLKFPFYRMEIDVFEFKLNKIFLDNVTNELNQRWNLRTCATDVCTIQQFEEEFTKLPSFQSNWPRIRKLLEAPIFRQILEEDQQRFQRLEPEEFE